MSNSYDELPYQSFPIEWTAPERLALASLLHGGPRQPLDQYRVLELGCGDGANLLPMAFFRGYATFVGVDGALSQIVEARSGRTALNLSNVAFIHADFLTADDQLGDTFDYIIAHGVFSWVSHSVREALFQLCAKRLRSNGLLYLNYNAYPGWGVRGVVRDFLISCTAGETGLLNRSKLAQEIASKIRSTIQDSEYPYLQLFSSELNIVSASDVSYVAHEYLVPENHAYWRSDFLELAGSYGFEYVTDADYNYPSGRRSENVVHQVSKMSFIGRTLEDVVDLLRYRQFHTPILTRKPLARSLPSVDEFANLWVASALAPSKSKIAGNATFIHPSGYRVETKQRIVEEALVRLFPFWPRSLRVGELFPDVRLVMDDLVLLHQNGLLELRCAEMAAYRAGSGPLPAFECSRHGYAVTALHTREDLS